MPVRLYLDHNVEIAVLLGLRNREVDVIRAFDDDAHELEDPALLRRARRMERVLVTYDNDFLRLAAQWQRDGSPFAGVVYVHSERLTIGQLIGDLEVLALAGEPEDYEGRVIFLPF